MDPFFVFVKFRMTLFTKITKIIFENRSYLPKQLFLVMKNVYSDIGNTLVKNITGNTAKGRRFLE